MDALATDTITQAGPLLAGALEIQGRYERQSSLDSRKKKGQYFTPAEVCEFMASMLTLPTGKTFRLLDPGAGAGALTAAVCDRISKLPDSCNLDIHLFENDAEVLPFLRETMRRCAEGL